MTIPDSATALGYTNPVWVSTATDEMFGYIKPEADTAAVFDFYEDESSAEYKVKGWLAEINPADEG